MGSKLYKPLWRNDLEKMFEFKGNVHIFKSRCLRVMLKGDQK